MEARAASGGQGGGAARNAPPAEGAGRQGKGGVCARLTTCRTSCLSTRLAFNMFCNNCFCSSLTTWSFIQGVRTICSPMADRWSLTMRFICQRNFVMVSIQTTWSCNKKHRYGRHATRQGSLLAKVMTAD